MDPMLLMLGVMLIAFIGLNMWSKKSNQKRAAEREKMMKEQLVPGAWVHTSVGFYGRFVDLDGDVLILETPSGEETYWNKAVIRSVGELPFQDDEAVEETEKNLLEDTPAVQLSSANEEWANGSETVEKSSLEETDEDKTEK